jgi:FkbM family methyltransferase
MDGSDTIDPTGYIKSRSLKFPKDGNYLTGKVRGLLRTGDYEREMTAAALRATHEGDTVLDLGCGLGFVAGMIAKRRNIAAIHGYDGNATLLTYAEAMLATNGIHNVTLTHGVLGKRKGSVPFHIRAPFAASSLASVEGDEAEPVSVDMHNTKTVLGDVKPSVIICDIEGGEADLLDGITLKEVRQVVIKLHPNHIAHAGVRRVFEAMHNTGMVFDPRLSTGRIAGFVAA